MIDSDKRFVCSKCGRKRYVKYLFFVSGRWCCDDWAECYKYISFKSNLKSKI